MKQLSELRKRPYTAKELFEKIVEILKENNEFPTILDYRSSSDLILQNDGFSLETELSFGSNEGIYLNIILLDENHNRNRMGTFKTLYETKEALCIMAVLGANFVWNMRKFVSEYSDDFAWSGYKVYPVKTDGSIPAIIYCPSTFEAAMIHIKKQLKSNNNVQYMILRDNEKKEDSVIKREDLME